MLRSTRGWTLVLFLLAACGGGGTSGGGFTLSANTATFTAEQEGPPPGNVTLTMTVTDSRVAYVGAAYVNGQTQPSWLGIDFPCTGKSCNVVLSIRSTFLAPGRYTSTFAVGTADANGEVLQSKDVTVTYTVTAPSPTSPGVFTLSASQASFAAVRNGTAPADVTLGVQVTGTGVASVATAPTIGSLPSWLGTSVSCTGAACDVVVSIRSTTLLVGQYTGSFLIRTLDAGGAVLRSKTVNVSYDVQTGVAIGGVAPALTFTYGDTRTSDTVSLPVTAGTRTWTAASDVAWLQVPADVHTGAATLAVTVDASTLAPGDHAGQVTVTDAADPLDTASITVTVHVVTPVLSVVQPSVLIGGADGLSSASQPLSFQLSAGASHPFTIAATTTSGGSWLLSSPASGSVGTAPVQLQLSADRTDMVGGTYTGYIRVSVTVRDIVLVKDVPVTYNLEASRLVVGATGVALSTSPGRSVLSRSVPVLSSIGRTDVPWTASSDQTWLTVSSSGTTGAPLTLTADPTGLAAGSYYATVTVASPDATVENEEAIRVGLHVLASDPASVTVTVPASFSAASPVEPVVFVTGNGADVLVYDVYTGQQVRKLTNVVAAAGAMAVSDDGRRLFVYDTTNLRVTEVDAVTGAFVRNYSASGTSSGIAVAYVRTAGQPTLVTPGAHAYDLTTGLEWPANGVRTLYGYSLMSSLDQGYMANDSGGIYRLNRTALAGGGFTAAYLFSPGTSQGREGQGCIRADGTVVYTASGYPYNFPGTSLATRQRVQTLPGDAYPNAIVCVWNGMVIGGADAYYDATDIWVYDGASGKELAKLSSAASTSYRSLKDRGMAVSADGTRLVTIAEMGTYGATTELRFQTLPSAP